MKTITNEYAALKARRHWEVKSTDWYHPCRTATGGPSHFFYHRKSAEAYATKHCPSGYDLWHYERRSRRIGRPYAWHLVASWRRSPTEQERKEYNGTTHFFLTY